MKRFLQIPAGAVALAFVMAFAPAPSMAADAPGDFVTGPAEGSPAEIALGYLDANKGELGLAAGDLSDLVISDQYLTKHNRVTHVYFQQRLGGVEVVNGLFNFNVMSDGRILSFGNRFVGNLAGKANAVSPSLQPEDAVARAAEHLGLDMGEGALFVLEVVGGEAMAVRFNDAGISRDDISAELKYFPLEDGAVRLVWSLMVQPLVGSDWWNVFVDAVNGEVLDKFNWTVNEGPAGAMGTGSDRDGLAARGVVPRAPDGYLVFPLPFESPDDGPQTVEVDPADGLASPFGWHDTNGAAGAEFTDTRGNNTFAQEDADANNSGGFRPDGGPTLDFLFPFDPGMQPTGGTNQEAAIVNLFYWNNIMHDVMYQYGFDPVSGNFQENNYGGGGLGSDPVQADAQDGSGTNNANFSTPPDGSDPRMQMFIWTNPNNAIFRINSPGGIAGDYAASHPTDWGGSLVPPTTADVEEVDDGSGSPSEGCGPLIGFTPGNIALIDRGNCEFGTKSLNAENAGAAGAVIVNDQQLPNGTIAMGGGVDGGSVTIPAIMIGNADGATIRAELPGVNATMQEPAGGSIDRDSDLDNGVIAHEYGHGISRRLIGGPANVGCLNLGDEQAGEGWSDWQTLTLFPLPSDTPTTNRGVGNYVTFQPVTGPGIRNFPYSTDLGVNPLTYADIGTLNVPHGVGEVWAALTWEMYWELVAKHGFDPDLYSGTGGNNLAIQLVVDGMKMQACDPTFVVARDAILDADVANNGGANTDEIWCAFAKRGLGFSATSGGNGVGDETEAFDLPPGVVCAGIFADGFESGDTAAWSNTVGD